MKVSVLVITYNHENFIAQAINSVLVQETNFPYEIIIGEDVSADRTRQIVLELEKRHPDKIRVLLQDANIAQRDRSLDLGGKTNFVNCLRACRGQYIALLDGDDYWTDVHKLQKQVDFLDAHPDFAICCHNAKMFYDDGKAPVNLLPPDQKAVSTIDDLIFANVIPTCSTVFRRGLFGELPDWFYGLKVGDWPIQIMNAAHGKIRYFNEVMAAYRFHERGYWSALTPVSQGLELIKMLGHVDAYLGFEYRKQIRAAQANWYWDIAQRCYRQDDRIQGRRYAKKYFWLGGFRARRNLLGFFLQLRTPTLYHTLRSVKEFVHSVTNNNPRVIGS